MGGVMAEFSFWAMRYNSHLRLREAFSAAFFFSEHPVPPLRPRVIAALLVLLGPVRVAKASISSLAIGFQASGPMKPGVLFLALPKSKAF